MPTFDTPEPIAAIIDIEAGHVRIHASDRADTVVEVRPSDEFEDVDVEAAVLTRVEYADGRLWVQVPKNKIRSLFGRPPSIDVTIELPSDSRVDAKASAGFSSEGRIGESTIDTAAGSIRLDQTGSLKLRTAAGDISVGRSAGHTDVTTSSGKIWIGAIDGTGVAQTSNGDITAGEVTGDVQLNTANGDITVDRALAAVEAKTAHGSIRIGEVVRGAVVLETNRGPVELGVRQGTTARLDVRAKRGSVRNDLEAAGNPKQSEETVEVRARTGNGDIVIRRL
ncbi:DUF4097 family beta strand repeat-containing protein [Nonomuraea africana]|uniref:DUF4097 and DUF4098 domain-containing protein YvlB n=1 Tax=Nonomuraea africana TaxID=46171 RepID=A0ABR9KV69_9ACTN|nr:DUF4097 family beta strand repeat-containing protein [Nonomuraea africana]MBE1565925.1 DUF4097 and DUF4098 domain-containing protein YvlB [Nonomuraea africana]